MNNDVNNLQMERYTPYIDLNSCFEFVTPLNHIDVGCIYWNYSTGCSLDLT